jgi:hypothetical protein
MVAPAAPLGPPVPAPLHQVPTYQPPSGLALPDSAFAPPGYPPLAPTAPSTASTLADPMLSPLAGVRPGQPRHDPTGASPLVAEAFAPMVFQPSGPPIAQPMQFKVKDPFAQPLRAVMFIFGVLCLAMFVTPVTGKPLSFAFDNISGAEVSALVVTLLPAIIGLVAILLSIIPMPTQIRGGIAAASMLALMIYPITLHGSPDWRQIQLLGAFLFVGGLLYRDVYREAILGRVVTTIGVLALMVPLLVPNGGEIPLILQFKMLADAPAADKAVVAVTLVPIILAFAGLLVWMPAPSPAGAKIIAWTFIFWAAVMALTALIAFGHIADVVKATPRAALLGWVPAVSLLGIGGYGIAAAMSSRE